MIKLKTIPDLAYINEKNPNWYKYYGYGVLLNGWTYEIGHNRNNQWTCWVYADNGKVYNARIDDPIAYNKLREKLQRIIKSKRK